jgi:peroxiredoxin
VPIATTDFTFTPPPEAAPFERTPPSALLAAGTDAPDFTVEESTGKAVRLSDLRGKVVVLKFWATWCWSCRQSLPHTDTLARQYADRDVVVLAVDIWDSKRAFRTWLSRRQGYDSLRFAIDPQPQGRDVATTLYHVSTTPTQYVVDREGKIVAAWAGYEGPDDRFEAALRAAGVSAPGRSASRQVPRTSLTDRTP